MMSQDTGILAGSPVAPGVGPATRSIDELPGPAGLPLLGNMLQLRPSTMHCVAESWSERYGPIFRFKLGTKCMVAISDLETINSILRDRPEGYRRWREFKEGADENGTAGVFAAEGDEWRRQRRLAVTALNSNHLHRYFDIVRTSNERLHRQLRELAHFRRTFDIGRELTSYSVDITSKLAFGEDLNTLERRHNVLQGHIQRVFATSGKRLGMPVPYWRWVRLPRDRAYDRSLAYIRHAVTRFIEQARQRLAERPELREAPENFLEGMLAAQEAEGTFTDEEIIGNTFTLLLAGEDTTAHTLAWTIWLLATRSEIQARCAEEADAAFDGERFPPEYECVEHLSYGEAVLRESMRLRPVAPVLLLEPLSDTTVMGTRIPAGTHLWLLSRYASLHEGVFERASEFDPQRWLIDEEDAKARNKAFLTFGGGPRFCPGRNLAFLESKSALGTITRSFEVELDAADPPVTEEFSFTMVPHGLRVRLRERPGASRPPAGVED